MVRKMNRGMIYYCFFILIYLNSTGFFGTCVECFISISGIEAKLYSQNCNKELTTIFFLKIVVKLKRSDPQKNQCYFFAHSGNNKSII